MREGGSPQGAMELYDPQAEVVEQRPPAQGLCQAAHDLTTPPACEHGGNPAVRSSRSSIRSRSSIDPR